MDVINIIELVVAFLGGSAVSLVTIPSAVRKAKAEARSADLDNLQKAVEGWKELADERQEANKEKDERIKELTEQVNARYVDIGTWRDNYTKMQEENARLGIELAKTEVLICRVRGCEKREPPTGY